ncbi:flagellar hook-length control protein FliK [Arthrobacter sp. LAPM80]|uniref:flagellar hook-length control protein FliK n=1 Tax=Arthrobacter sp. LAPM80 TaxID=3141788 RepID=UPI00398AE3E6
MKPVAAPSPVQQSALRTVGAGAAADAGASFDARLDSVLDGAPGRNVMTERDLSDAGNPADLSETFDAGSPAPTGGPALPGRPPAFAASISHFWATALQQADLLVAGQALPTLPGLPGDAVADDSDAGDDGDTSGAGGDGAQPGAVQGAGQELAPGPAAARAAGTLWAIQLPAVQAGAADSALQTGRTDAAQQIQAAGGEPAATAALQAEGLAAMGARGAAASQSAPAGVAPVIASGVVAAGAPAGAAVTEPAVGPSSRTVPPTEAHLAVHVDATALPTVAMAPTPQAQVQAPAPVAVPVSAPVHASPLAEQLARPLFTLAAAPLGEHVMKIDVVPDSLGPVTVRAHLGADGVRIELMSASEAGREGLRSILADLRRDLAAGGMTSTLSLGGGNTTPDHGGHRSFQGPANPWGPPGRDAKQDRQTPRARAPEHPVAANDSLDITV